MARETKDKRKMVKRKNYPDPIALGYATKVWETDRKLEMCDSQNRREIVPQAKVKQRELMAVVKMMEYKNSQDHNKSLIKSTKQRRELFTDGHQVMKQDVRKRTVSKDGRTAVFSGSGKNQQQNEKDIGKELSATTTIKVKRYHSANAEHERKHGRQRLREEKPVDLGGILHEKLKNWSPHIGSNVKGKIPFVGNKSKSYDLLKGKGDQTISINSSLRPSRSSETPNSEIYISLEKKSTEEKEEFIKQSEAQLFSDYVQLSDSSACKNAKEPKDNEKYSQIKTDNGMLF